MRVGSEDHKRLFCEAFTAGHRAFEPETLPWPELSEVELKRLRSVPFWQEVFYTERRAGALVEAFAKTVEDPLIRAAIDLQGYEESRHGRLIRTMIERYGIDAQEVPLGTLPADAELAFIDFGFGECLDAFLGFGVFKIAREGGFLPESMFEIFDLLMYEETRHIVFFVNWMAWREAHKGREAGWLRAFTSAWYYARAVGRLVGTVRRGAEDETNFSATQADLFLEDFSLKGLLRDCLSENSRRMGELDARQLQPRLLPALGRMALTGMELWPFGPRPTPKAA